MVRLATIAVLMLIALGSPASAGGWAVTTLEAVPDRIEAGRGYDIRYTIRQHGTTPVDLPSTGIRVTSVASGRQLTFDGRREGAAGHYVARVTFPEAGAWRWEALQDWFGPYALGEVTVGAGAGAVGAPSGAGRGAPLDASASAGLVVAGLLLALSAVAVLLGRGIAAAATRARA